ncbi:MAG: DUF2971 domain-containing protein [Firmicutes bacterium]|nr:DUF2971 domain-containing protein [Bacillota bacterium]
MKPWKSVMLSNLFPKEKQLIEFNKGLEIKYENIPRKLFKYQSFNKFSKKNLLDNVIWLEYPEKFNDPYDCALTYSTKDLSNHFVIEEIEKMLSTIPLGKYAPTIEEKKQIVGSEDKYLSLFEVIVKKEDSISIETREQLLEAIRTYLNKRPTPFSNIDKVTKGVLIASCFSEVNNSIKMWSHYADCHKGFCLEYDFKSLPYTDLRTRLLFPIIYQSELFDVTEYLKNAKKENFNPFFAVRAAITKSIEWKYEKEWRLILPFGVSNETREMTVPSPKAIYAGSKINSSNKAFLNIYSKSKNIPLYQSTMSKNEFKVKFEREL